MKELEARLLDLETRVAFQDDQLDSLNTALLEAYARIERLELGYKLLKEQVAQGDAGINTGDETPPHY